MAAQSDSAAFCERNHSPSGAKDWHRPFPSREQKLCFHIGELWRFVLFTRKASGGQQGSKNVSLNRTFNKFCKQKNLEK